MAVTVVALDRIPAGRQNRNSLRGRRRTSELAGLGGSQREAAIVVRTYGYDGGV